MSFKCSEGTRFFKENENDTIWWRYSEIPEGEAFSFDRETLYLFPFGYEELTAEQKAIFDRENPRRAAYLHGRNIW